MVSRLVYIDLFYPAAVVAIVMFIQSQGVVGSYFVFQSSCREMKMVFFHDFIVGCVVILCWV